MDHAAIRALGRPVANLPRARGISLPLLSSLAKMRVSKRFLAKLALPGVSRQTLYDNGIFLAHAVETYRAPEKSAGPKSRAARPIGVDNGRPADCLRAWPQTAQFYGE